MNKGYWIVRSDITDTVAFADYAAKTPQALAQFGGKFLVRAGQSVLVEGSSRARTAVIEFPSYQSALDCWESETYQRIKAIRLGAAELDIVIIEGLLE